MTMPLFDGPESGPFADSKITPTAMERTVAEVVWGHRGRKQAISLAWLCKVVGKSERTVKGLIEQLVVTHRMRIGGYRGADGNVGYAVIVDAEDLAATVGPYKAQIISMWRRLRVLLNRTELAELQGQMRLED